MRPKDLLFRKKYTLNKEEPDSLENLTRSPTVSLTFSCFGPNHGGQFPVKSTAHKEGTKFHILISIDLDLKHQVEEN